MRRSANPENSNLPTYPLRCTVATEDVTKFTAWVKLSNCLECFVCPWILDLHWYLLELIMSSSVMKNTFIMSLDFTASYTDVTEAIWSSLWRHSLNRSLPGVTLKPVCLYLRNPVLLVFHLFWSMQNNWNTKFKTNLTYFLISTFVSHWSKWLLGNFVSLRIR